MTHLLDSFKCFVNCQSWKFFCLFLSSTSCVNLCRPQYARNLKVLMENRINLNGFGVLYPLSSEGSSRHFLGTFKSQDFIHLWGGLQIFKTEVSVIPLSIVQHLHISLPIYWFRKHWRISKHIKLSFSNLQIAILTYSTPELRIGHRAKFGNYETLPHLLIIRLLTW